MQMQSGREPHSDPASHRPFMARIGVARREKMDREVSFILTFIQGYISWARYPTAFFERLVPTKHQIVFFLRLLENGSALWRPTALEPQKCSRLLLHITSLSNLGKIPSLSAPLISWPGQ
ncbi:hypothetical protein I7I48_10448 [Histoplasma ohiense]|nr:hypothetical protein I7I48_10448 [Histoplasma ohiense (nom. inval.)]